MGQLTTSSNRNGRHGINIDMTPMVDLAFLLLTFFVLTMTINKKTAMQVQMPDSRETSPTTPINIKRVLTVVLHKDDRVYYYRGDKPKVQITNFSNDGIRNVLLNSTKTIPELVLLIKPSKESKYKNLVDLLDEVDITHVQHYYIVKETNEDRQQIASSRAMVEALRSADN